MIELGKKQKLTVVKSVDFGVYLGEDMQADAKNRVLLPSRQVPEGTKEGDSIEAFIYKDSQDRLIATTKEPKLQVGQTAVLKVSQVTRIGAFLDWGLEKDLLLPYHEQTLKVREGEDVLVALYIDKSSRLCATMKVYHYLSTRTPYVVGDMVKGRVYEISDRFGVFVAVDDKYSALIPAREAKGKYRPGKILELRVSEVKEDGKMNVTDRQKAYLQINEDAENVLEVINEFAGVLPFDDKASPEVIQREFGLSKGAFKRAIGHLMKEGKVQHWGMCEVSADTIRKAHAVCPLTAIQSEYHLMHRLVEENGVLDVCRELGIGFVPYSPINRGFLGGTLNEYTVFDVNNDNRHTLPRFQPDTMRANTRIVNVLQDFGRPLGMTSAQVALGWLLQKAPWIVPIPGTTKLSHLEENLRTFDFNLSSKEWHELENAVAAIPVMGDRYNAEQQRQVGR